MRNLLREILRDIINLVRTEIAFYRFLRRLKRHPPEKNKWRDAVNSITLVEWRDRVYALHKSIRESPPEPPKPKQHAKRKRTKFKKWWPHGKHSG